MVHRRYIHIIHPSITFAENLACYKAAASRLPWMSASSWAEWSIKRPEWQDPNNVIIFWLYGLPGLLDVIPQQRKAALAIWYMESVGPIDKLCPPQKATLARFLDYFKTPDIVIATSPPAAAFLKPYCKKVTFAPTGYEPKVMGTPDWTRIKEYDFGYCGWPTGRRDWIIPALENHFGNRMIHFFGPYGQERKLIYEKCRATLYIAHSDEPSFPGFRIWQSVATSSALVTEKRDVWPATAGRHYVEVPEAKKEDVGEFVAKIEQTLNLPLEEIARRAHTELSLYAVDRAMEYITAAI